MEHISSSPNNVLQLHVQYSIEMAAPIVTNIKLHLPQSFTEFDVIDRECMEVKAGDVMHMIDFTSSIQSITSVCVSELILQRLNG